MWLAYYYYYGAYFSATSSQLRLKPVSARSMAVSVTSKRLKGKTAVLTASTDGLAELKLFFFFFCEAT